jgi:hypothetical protein
MRTAIFATAVVLLAPLAALHAADPSQAILTGSPLAANPRESPPRPNMILILADDK